METISSNMFNSSLDTLPPGLQEAVMHLATTQSVSRWAVEMLNDTRSHSCFQQPLPPMVLLHLLPGLERHDDLLCAHQRAAMGWAARRPHAVAGVVVH